jgi:hypothetical protein
MTAKKTPKPLHKFDQDYLTVERAMLEDTINVRWREIRAITGCVDESMNVIDGASTLYLEGQLGFQVNHTREEVVAMIKEKMDATPS